MKMDWPQYVALYQPATDAAFIMRKFKDVSSQVNVAAVPTAAPAQVLAFCREYTCGVCHAYYLPRITVEVENGKALPLGTLSVTLNGSTVLEEPLSFFLPRAEPPDFLETYPWKDVKAKGFFKALVAISEDQADSRQIGLMIDKGSMMEIMLKDVVTQEKTTLRIGIPLAEYSTLLPEDEKK